MKTYTLAVAAVCVGAAWSVTDMTSAALLAVFGLMLAVAALFIRD